MNTYTQHAQREMTLANFDPKDIEAVLQILKIVLDRWDSGGSLAVIIPILMRLLNLQPLSPLTGQEDEWEDLSKDTGSTLLQNRRCSTVFKNGRNSFDINKPSQPVTFPYTP